MCMISFVGDEFNRSVQERYPVLTVSNNLPSTYVINSGISREEFDKLKVELEAIKKVLIAAKIYDEETGQKDCEQAEKVALLKRLAELCNVDLSEIFDRK